MRLLQIRKHFQSVTIIRVVVYMYNFPPPKWNIRMMTMKETFLTKFSLGGGLHTYVHTHTRSIYALFQQCSCFVNCNTALVDIYQNTQWNKSQICYCFGERVYDVTFLHVLWACAASMRHAPWGILEITFKYSINFCFYEYTAKQLLPKIFINFCSHFFLNIAT